MSRTLAHDWWTRAVTFAGLKPKRGRGRHSLRQEFAPDLMDLPLIAELPPPCEFSDVR